MLTNQFGSAPGQPRQEEPAGGWSHKYLRDQTTANRQGPLAWWYRLTAPPEPAASASFAVREAARRGLLASTLMFYLYVVLCIVLPIGIFTPNHTIAIAVPLVMLLGMVALIFNRRGRSNVTGLLIVIGLEAALVSVIRLSPGGLDPSMLGLFDILVFTEVFVASLLPINWVIGAALFNIAFIIFDLATQGPHGDPLMVQMMHQNFAPVILRPILLHIVVSVVLWLWVRGASQAIERADRAEVIATLEHEIAEQEHSLAEEKRLLDMSIQQILQVHVRVANGDFDARVRLAEGEPLWPVAGSLNNLLSRLQRLRLTEQEVQRIQPRLQRAAQLEHEFKRLKSEIQYAYQVVMDAEREQQSIHMRRSGTILDPLSAELHGKYLLSRLLAPGQMNANNGPNTTRIEAQD